MIVQWETKPLQLFLAGSNLQSGIGCVFAGQFALAAVCVAMSVWGLFTWRRS